MLKWLIHGRISLALPPRLMGGNAQPPPPSPMSVALSLGAGSEGNTKKRAERGSKAPAAAAAKRPKAKRDISEASFTFASAPTVVPIGPVFQCDACLARSDCEPWGVHQTITSADGNAQQQPVGNCCAKHFAVHQKCHNFMKFTDFCEKYKADAHFKNEVDTLASTISSGETSPNNFGRESVSMETQQLLVIESSSYSVLRESDLKNLGGNASKAARAAPLYLPCNLDGKEGSEVVYFMSNGVVDYPKAKIVTMIGPATASPRWRRTSTCSRRRVIWHFLHTQDQGFELTRVSNHSLQPQHIQFVNMCCRKWFASV